MRSIEEQIANNVENTKDIQNSDNSDGGPKKTEKGHPVLKKNQKLMFGIAAAFFTVVIIYWVLSSVMSPNTRKHVDGVGRTEAKVIGNIKTTEKGVSDEQKQRIRTDVKNNQNRLDNDNTPAQAEGIFDISLSDQKELISNEPDVNLSGTEAEAPKKEEKKKESSVKKKKSNFNVDRKTINKGSHGTKTSVLTKLRLKRFEALKKNREIKEIESTASEASVVRQNHMYSLAQNDSINQLTAKETNVFGNHTSGKSNTMPISATSGDKSKFKFNLSPNDLYSDSNNTKSSNDTSPEQKTTQPFSFANNSSDNKKGPDTFANNDRAGNKNEADITPDQGTNNRSKTKAPNDTQTAKTETSDGRGYIPGDVVLASAINGLKSTTKSPVLMVKIVTGPLKGARLTFTPTVDYDMYVFQSTEINIGKKREKIKAIIITPDENLSTGYRSDVNYHTMYKLGMLWAYGMAKGAASLVNAFSNSIDTSDTSTIVSSDYGTSDLIIAGAGGVADAATDIVKKETTIPPTVTVNAKDIVGVMFVDSFNPSWLPVVPDDEYSIIN